MLLLQGLLFYVPHWVWKNWEEGKVRMISDGMRGTAASISDDKNNRLVRISTSLNIILVPVSNNNSKQIDNSELIGTSIGTYLVS